MSAQRILESLQSDVFTGTLCVRSTVLPLNAEDWDSEVITMMNWNARTNESVESLSISPAELTLQACKPFETLLEHSTKLSELEIWCHEEDEQDCDEVECEVILSRLLFAASKNPKSSITTCIWKGAEFQCSAAMLYFLSSLPNLRRVYFNSRFLESPALLLDASDARVLAQTFLRMKSLEELSMPVRGEGGRVLLSEMGQLSSLKRISLGTEEEPTLLEALRLPSTNLTLGKLQIANYGGDDSSVFQFPSLPSESKLESLELSYLVLAPGGLQHERNSSLKELDLTQCEIDGDVLTSTPLLGLKKISFWDCTLPAHRFALPTSPLLEEVGFYACGGIDTHVFASIEPYAPHLKVLRANGCQGQALEETQNWAFLSRFVQLEELELTVSPSTNIADVVQNAPKVLKLDFSDFRHPSLEWTSRLLEALRTSNVQGLRLVGMDPIFVLLRTDLAVAISRGELPLKEFRAWPCSEEGGDEFFAGLGTNNALQELELDMEVQSAMTAEAILSALNVNETLSSFKISFSSELETYEKKVDHLVSLNKYGRKLLRLPEDSVPLGLWPVVLSRAAEDEELSVLFHFLKTKSDLVQPKGNERKRRAPQEASSTDE